MNFESTFDKPPRDQDFGHTVLIIDDEVLGINNAKLICSETDETDKMRLLSCSSISQALEILATTLVHVVLLDKNLGPNDKVRSQNGIESIPDLLRVQPHLQIVMLTGSNETQDIVHAMNLGACDYLVKDKMRELFVPKVNQAIRVAKLALEKAYADRAQVAQTYGALLGKSKAVKHLLFQLGAVAESDKSVLLLGDTGVGKSTASRLIHHYRMKFLKQKDRPFREINIGALPANTVEAELFGTEPGAYTGALSKIKAGIFELANGGTLFLDEIGEASPDLQVKLLKVIEEGKFIRLGGQTVIHAKFKLICATNRDLVQMIESGKFREDLYMRIATFPIRVPNLQERKEDIPEIIKAILPKVCADNKVYIGYKDIPKECIDHICKNPIPGNIRGLDHLFSRLLVHSTKDTKGKPMWDNWETILEGTSNALGSEKKRNAQEGSISLSQLMNAPLDVMGEGFPGLRTFLDSITNRVYFDAMSKYRRNKEIAKVLGLSESAVSLKIRGLEIAQEKANNLLTKKEALQ